MRRAKIIVSHDIDHLYTTDHFFDLYLPKFIIKSIIELITGRIKIKTLITRAVEIICGKLNNVDELIQFNDSNNIPNNFFIAVEKGRSLGYRNKEAKIIGEQILKKNGELYLHGISDSGNKIENQIKLFENIFKIKCRGLRYHYLSGAIEAGNLAKYLSFDSSVQVNGKSYMENGMIEFPIHVMDSTWLTEKKYYSIKDDEINCEYALEKINEFEENGCDYIVINFHDRYFSKSFPGWKRWYIDLINKLSDSGYVFIAFSCAVSEKMKNEKLA